MLSEFYHRFGNDGTEPQQYFCPGRINLIGEHIDYNGGLVLPAAISLGITLIIRPREDGKIRLQSAQFDEIFSFNITDKKEYNTANGWANFPLGCIDFLWKKGMPITGADMYYESTLPLGSGLSSSAGIEVLTLFALHNLFGQDDYATTQIALDAQSIENNFIGMQCGIMDQFAVAMGKENQALKLNCETLEYEYIPADFGDYTLVIINSNKPRALVHSAYNQRLAECREALQIINQNHNYLNLCEVPLAVAEAELTGILLQRARHCITEQLRVEAACAALAENNMALFAQQLIGSHLSLLNDYEVTGVELDALFVAATNNESCLAVRMTGAGFGGCAIALVATNSVELFKKNTAEEYKKHTGLTPLFYECNISGGVKKLYC